MVTFVYTCLMQIHKWYEAYTSTEGLSFQHVVTRIGTPLLGKHVRNGGYQGLFLWQISLYNIYNFILPSSINNLQECSEIISIADNAAISVIVRAQITAEPSNRSYDYCKTWDTSLITCLWSMSCFIYLKGRQNIIHDGDGSFIVGVWHWQVQVVVRWGLAGAGGG